MDKHCLVNRLRSPDYEKDARKASFLLYGILRVFPQFCPICLAISGKIVHDRGNGYFPEISYDQIDKVRGMDIIICTTANTDEEARELLTLMGAPFAK